MPFSRKKITFSGSMTQRIVVVCLTFLVLPLTLHTFFLYHREVEIVEQEVRATLKGFGETIASRIGAQIIVEWKVLDAESPALIQAFAIKKYTLPKGADDHFVFVSSKHDLLVVGKKIDSLEAHGISHPLAEILKLSSPPFPISVELGAFAPKGDWAESFPIPGTQLTLSLATSSEQILDLQTARLIERIGSFIVFVLVLGGILVYWLISKINRPLRSLQLTLERIGEGAIHSRYAPLSWGFEINQIGKQINQTLDQMLEQQQAVEKERLTREKLALELKLAREIQDSLLPKELASFHALQGFPGYLPALEVSGDFYDVYPLSEGKILIAIGDVSGKGIAACLYSLGLRSALRAFAESIGDLSEIARKTNEQFLQDVKESGYFATLWVGLYEKSHLTFASFGHPPALLKTKNGIEELSTHEMAFGLKSFAQLKTKTIQLAADDTLLLYTDGVIEAHSKDGELYGVERLKKALHDSSSLFREIEEFSYGAAQHDDITFVLFRIKN